MIQIDKSLLQADGSPTVALLGKLLEMHEKKAKHLEGLRNIAKRKHEIGNRIRLHGLPNNKITHDLPGYIVTMAAGYLVGEPVTYTPEEEAANHFEPIREALKAAISDNVDAELAVDAATYGKGVEVYYADEQSRPRIAQMDACSSFVVYDDTVEHNPLLGVSCANTLNDKLEDSGKRITVYTADELIVYEVRDRGMPLQAVSREQHYFGGVPLVEYWNNSKEEGDFEPVMDLINAYDVLQSDRVNDKQQFTDSILALYGIGALGAQDTEEYDMESEEEQEERPPERKDMLTPSQRLRQTKTLFMPGDGAKAEWLTKPLAEADTEILRKSLQGDIHKFSLVPDLTDENFAGNISGVAMRYKLFGLEQLTKIKERWFREGLRCRLRLFANFLSRKGAAAMDTDTVQISFKRSLPVNEVEIAQMVQSYQGLVPEELLLAQVPFVEDAEAAAKLLKAEKEEAAKAQREAFAARNPMAGAHEKDDAE